MLITDFFRLKNLLFLYFQLNIHIRRKNISKKYKLTPTLSALPLRGRKLAVEFSEESYSRLLKGFMKLFRQRGKLDWQKFHFIRTNIFKF